jgi:hypothetical protein
MFSFSVILFIDINVLIKTNIYIFLRSRLFSIPSKFEQTIFNKTVLWELGRLTGKRNIELNFILKTRLAFSIKKAEKSEFT